MTEPRRVAKEDRVWTLEAFDQCAGKGIGLNCNPSDLSDAHEIAAEYGLGSLTIKRDDLLPALHGGTKLRKLNYLLAQPKYSDASEWHAVGSIGSGNLVAIAQVAALLGKKFHAHCFWVPITRGIVENLSQLTANHVTISYYSSLPALLFSQASLFVGGNQRVVIPPGSTCAHGMIGIARAGVELSEQIRSGSCRKPRRIYLPLGSGGTAAGLAVGLALGGIDSTVRAVAVVEHLISSRFRINGLVRKCVAILASKGIEAHGGLRAVPIEIERGCLGKGYAHPTEGSRTACDVGREHGYHLEEVYSGKAFAALLDEARVEQQCEASRDVLLWFTPHGENLPRAASDWQRALPMKLRQHLGATAPHGISRRRLLQGGVALTVCGFVWSRFGGYGPIENWTGRVLATWEARVLQAAIEAVAPSQLGLEVLKAVVSSAPEKIDTYLAGMPKWFIAEVHALFGLIEHGTLLNLRFSRFTALTVQERRRVLEGLHDYGWLIAQGYKGIRDLSLMAIYRHRDSWGDIEYDGPRLPRDEDDKAKRNRWRKYEALRAPRGTIPS